MAKSQYKQILFKVSGEALMGSQEFGIDPEMTARIASDVKEAVGQGTKIAMVVGGGNIFRGVSLAAKGADRVSGDHIGMLATVMNAKALKMALDDAGLDVVILSGLAMPQVCETFTQHAMEAHLKAGKVIIFAGGTGNPYFTTDTGAALRACEMKADAILKGTQVDGVYSADPKKHPNPERFDRISYDEMLAKGLKVMDEAAIVLARNAQIPVLVFSLKQAGGLARVLRGEGRYTTVTI